MADLFGQAHLASLREDFIGLADILQDIAQLIINLRKNVYNTREENKQKNALEQVSKRVFIFSSAVLSWKRLCVLSK